MKAETRAIVFVAHQLRVERMIAEFFAAKARHQAGEAGHYRAALNLRKQGVPLNIALALFFGRT